eukprot:scaffold269489_cov24-Tisochrysis_lutea.AAC.5
MRPGRRRRAGDAPLRAARPPRQQHAARRPNDSSGGARVRCPPAPRGVRPPRPISPCSSPNGGGRSPGRAASMIPTAACRARCESRCRQVLRRRRRPFAYRKSPLRVSGAIWGAGGSRRAPSSSSSMWEARRGQRRKRPARRACQRSNGAGSCPHRLWEACDLRGRLTAAKELPLQQSLRRQQAARSGRASGLGGRGARAGAPLVPCPPPAGAPAGAALTPQQPQHPPQPPPPPPPSRRSPSGGVKRHTAGAAPTPGR